MKKTMSVVIILLAAIFQSCNKIKGDGPIVNKTYNLQDFTSVDANIDADVYITQDNFYKVEIQAQQNIQDIIETPIVNGELTLTFEKYKNIRRHDHVVIYITMPSVAGLSINGSGNVRATNNINTNSLTLKVNGSGSISIPGLTGQSLAGSITGSGNITINGGSVNNEALRISGSGNIDLLGLSAKFVATQTSGSGKTSVRVSDNLDVHISGSGDVYYIGNPSVHSEISGSGKVSHM